MIERSKTLGRVAGASGVIIKRVITGGRILDAGVAKEGVATVGRVVGAGGVVIERRKTGGRVIAAGCVA